MSQNKKTFWQNLGAAMIAPVAAVGGAINTAINIVTRGPGVAMDMAADYVADVICDESYSAEDQAFVAWGVRGIMSFCWGSMIGLIMSGVYALCLTSIYVVWTLGYIATWSALSLVCFVVAAWLLWLGFTLIKAGLDLHRQG